MSDLFHQGDRCCGLCQHWTKGSGEYSAAQRTCANAQCGWYRAPKKYSDGVGCGFWEGLK